MRGRVFLFIACAVFLFNTPVFAEELSIKEELAQLKSRIEMLEKKVAEQDTYIGNQNKTVQTQQKLITEYEKKLSEFEVKLHRVPGEVMPIMEGLELGVGSTMIVQGTNKINNASADVQKKKSKTDGSYSADITLAKEFKEVKGRAFVHLEIGQGEGLTDDLTLYSNVNGDIVGSTDMRAVELWYEQDLFNDKAQVTFGKLDPTAYFDQNEYANDETTQFLNNMFINSPTTEFPDYSAGLRVAYLPKDWVEVGYGMFNTNSEYWDKVFDNLFNIGQVHFKTNFFNLPGNYRFYGWSNNVYHTEWLDSLKTKEAAYGFGLSFDQKINDVAGAFARYGWQNPEVYNPENTATGGLNYSLAHSWSAGFQVEGKPWKRENDVLGFAVGQIFPSNDYKKAGAESIPARRAEAEGHLEAYYKIWVNKHLSLSPDFQYIWNAFGKDVSADTGSVFVGGMRAQIDF